MPNNELLLQIRDINANTIQRYSLRELKAFRNCIVEERLDQQAAYQQSLMLIEQQLESKKQQLRLEIDNIDADTLQRHSFGKLDELEEFIVDEREAYKQILDIITNEINSRQQPVLENEQARARLEYEQAKAHFEETGWFPWPSTDAPASTYGYSGDFFWYGDGNVQGVLSYIGYRVGNNGELEITRQHLLDCVFHNELPNINSQEHMAEWDDRKTPQRLKKMADAIAAFTRNAKRRQRWQGTNFTQAIANWEADLEYLYQKYYCEHFGFNNPDTIAIHFDWPSTDNED